METKNIGNYMELEHLGSGRLCEVYKAQQKFNKRIARAVKIFRFPVPDTDDKLRAFLMREAVSCCELYHDNIVHTVEFGLEGTSFFVVSDLMAGPSLDSKLVKNHTLSPQQAHKLAADAAAALNYAHEIGILHRSLSPRNVFFRENSTASLISDFSTARIAASPLLADFAKTLPPDTLLKFLTPPEAANGIYDSRSDIYQLGGLLYLSLAGYTVLETSLKPDIAQFRDDLSEPFAELIMKCLSPDPAKRPVSARAVLTELIYITPSSKQQRPAVEAGLGKLEIEPIGETVSIYKPAPVEPQKTPEPPQPETPAEKEPEQKLKLQLASAPEPAQTEQPTAQQVPETKIVLQTTPAAPEVPAETSKPPEAKPPEVNPEETPTVQLATRQPAQESAAAPEQQTSVAKPQKQPELPPETKPEEQPQPALENPSEAKPQEAVPEAKPQEPPAKTRPPEPDLEKPAEIKPREPATEPKPAEPKVEETPLETPEPEPIHLVEHAEEKPKPQSAETTAVPQAPDETAKSAEPKPEEKYSPVFIAPKKVEEEKPKSVEEDLEYYQREPGALTIARKRKERMTQVIVIIAALLGVAAYWYVKMRPAPAVQPQPAAKPQTATPAVSTAPAQVPLQQPATATAQVPPPATPAAAKPPQPAKPAAQQKPKEENFDKGDVEVQADPELEKYSPESLDSNGNGALVDVEKEQDNSAAKKKRKQAGGQ